MPRPRGTGCLYRQKGSAVWWVKYYRGGRAYRESTRTTNRRKAEMFLRRRLAEVTTGLFFGPRVERIRVQELAEDFLRDYRVNGRKSYDDAEARWRLHLKPFFGHLRAADVGTDLIARYAETRQNGGAKNATINRELAALRRMFYLGFKAAPPKVYRVPSFPHLEENNVRTGFVEEPQFRSMVEHCHELWLRTMIEIAYQYGWREDELLSMRVKQADLLGRVLRLNPGTTKNNEGREVAITETIRTLLQECAAGKMPDDYLFTREGGKRVKDFRGAWAKMCCAAGLGKFVCPKCRSVVDADRRCAKCEQKWQVTQLKYIGLIFHDLRRSAARENRKAGITESVIMKMGGWKTRTVFERYNIVTQADVKQAVKMRDEHRNGHSFGHSALPEARPATVGMPPKSLRVLQ